MWINHALRLGLVETWDVPVWRLKRRQDSEPSVSGGPSDTSRPRPKISRVGCRQKPRNPVASRRKAHKIRHQADAAGAGEGNGADDPHNKEPRGATARRGNKPNKVILSVRGPVGAWSRSLPKLRCLSCLPCVSTSCGFRLSQRSASCGRGSRMGYRDPVR
jgi:hypothetical protein